MAVNLKDKGVLTSDSMIAAVLFPNSTIPIAIKSRDG